MAYALSTWDPAPRRFEVDGFQVRLEGFLYQDQNIMYVTGSNRGRISLLVVPPVMADSAGLSHDQAGQAFFLIVGYTSTSANQQRVQDPASRHQLHQFLRSTGLEVLADGLRRRTTP